MLSDRGTASEISDLLIEIGTRLNNSLFLVKERCSPAEYDQYCAAVGMVMGHIFLEVLRPLYKRHPDLKPDGLD